MAAVAVGYLAIAAPLPPQDRAVLWLLMASSYVAVLLVLTAGVHGGRLGLWWLRGKADGLRPALHTSRSLALSGFLSLLLLSQLSVVFCYREEVVRTHLPPLGRLPTWAEAVIALVALALPFAVRAHWRSRGRWPGIELAIAAVAAPLAVLVLPQRHGQLPDPIPRPSAEQAAGASDPAREARPVVLVCLDGLDRGLLDVARRQVSLPTFDRLRREGLVSALDNDDYGFSPVVWNSVSTGTPVAVHGIFDFYTRSSPLFTSSVDPWWKPIPIGFGMKRVLKSLARVGLFQERVAGGGDRQGPSLWQLLSERGRSSLVVNYLQSYPAERIRGVFASWNLYWQLLGHQRKSDHFRMTAEGEGHSGFVHPAGALERHLHGPNALGPELEGGELLEQSGDEFRFLSELTLRLTAEQPFDVITFYSAWPDVFNHRFTVDELEGMRASRFETERARAFLAMCKEVDAFLEKLQAQRPEANVVVLSDHGVGVFNIGKRRGVHHQEGVPGILLAAGPDVRPHEAPGQISMFDILPTVLHYFGLPLDHELHGRVQGSLLDNPAPIQRVEGWRDRVGNPRVDPQDDAQEAAIRERLRAVGYID